MKKCVRCQYDSKENWSDYINNQQSRFQAKKYYKDSTRYFDSDKALRDCQKDLIKTEKSSMFMLLITQFQITSEKNYNHSKKK